MAATLDMTPTPQQLANALEQLLEQEKIHDWDVSGGEWTVTSALPRYDGHTRKFADIEALDKHLQLTYDMVALFRPVYVAEKDDKRAVVKRDTIFEENWMVSRFVTYHGDEYYEGCVKFEDKSEAQEYARQWTKRDTVLFDKDDFRSAETLI